MLTSLFVVNILSKPNEYNKRYKLNDEDNIDQHDEQTTHEPTPQPTLVPFDEYCRVFNEMGFVYNVSDEFLKIYCPLMDKLNSYNNNSTEKYSLINMILEVLGCLGGAVGVCYGIYLYLKNCSIKESKTEDIELDIQQV